MTDAPPPILLSADLREELALAGLSERVDAFLATAPRRCIDTRSTRAASYPLDRGPFGRLLGLPIAEPVLPALASKLGGRPYVEEPALSWSAHTFLGQVNFADLPPLDGVPRAGILGLDLSNEIRPDLRLRWYPDPSEARAVPCRVESAGAWTFRRGWALTGTVEWYALLDDAEPHLRDLWGDVEVAGYDEGSRDGCHRLFGPRSLGLHEPGVFETRDGRSDPIECYEVIVRLTYDLQADFGWGSSWIHVLAHRDDLAAGDLGRAFVVTSSY